MPAHHRVDLETAAALGCRKCIDELETGTKKNRQCHDAHCPRGRYYRRGAPSNSAITPASASASAAATAGPKRKRPQDSSNEGGNTDNTFDTRNAARRSKEGDDDADKPSDPSVPLRIGNSIDFPLSNLRPNLICSLCKGYFRDPHTVAECLHTFCRSCLILFFRQGMRCCPTCNTRLGPDPFHTSISIQSREVIPDRTLKEVVNKIFPWMKAKEEEEERLFYEQRGIELKSAYSQETEVKTRGQGRASGKPTAANGAMNDMIDLRMEPDGNSPHPHQRLPSLRNSFIRTSGRLKIASLKKYLSQKLGMKDAKNSIEILCNGDAMGDELNLTFILRTRWFSSNQVLTLRYRLEEVEEDTKLHAD